MSKTPGLTREQEARLQEYRQRSFEIGMCTDRSDRSAVKGAVERILFVVFGKRSTMTIKWFESPRAYLGERLPVKRLRRLFTIVEFEPFGLRFHKRAIERLSPWDDLNRWTERTDSFTVAQVRNSLHRSADPCIRQLFEFIPQSLRSVIGRESRLADHAAAANVGQSNAPEILFYLFCAQVLGVKFDKGLVRFLHAWLSVAESCYCWWDDGACRAVCERPAAVKTEQSTRGRRIHCDDGPAIVFPDGWAVYALHGVQVSQQVVETQAEALDPKIVLTERNAEVRREIVRKIGLERLFASLGASRIDKDQGYELVSLELGDGRRRPYLSMINPSTGTSHIEGVHPSCTTVREALSWRNGTSIPPEQMT